MEAFSKHLMSMDEYATNEPTHEPWHHTRLERQLIDQYDRLSPVSVEKASREVAPEELLASGAILRHIPNPLHWVRRGDLHGIAQVFEPTLGETVSSLHAATAAPNNLCIVTIDFREPFDSSSTLTLWRSLRWSEPSA